MRACALPSERPVQAARTSKEHRGTRLAFGSTCEIHSSGCVLRNSICPGANPKRLTGFGRTWRSARCRPSFRVGLATVHPSRPLRKRIGSRSTSSISCNSATLRRDRKYRAGSPGKATIAMRFATCFRANRARGDLDDFEGILSFKRSRARRIADLRKAGLMNLTRTAPPITGTGQIALGRITHLRVPRPRCRQGDGSLMDAMKQTHRNQMGGDGAHWDGQRLPFDSKFSSFCYARALDVAFRLRTLRIAGRTPSIERRRCFGPSRCEPVRIFTT